MTSSSIVFTPIGLIHSGHLTLETTPIQPVYAADCEGRAELSPEYAEGLTDIEGFSHVYLIYHLHRAPAPRLLVKPFLEDIEHGIFATRAPARPNAIGMSLVRLLRREGCVLHLSGIDVLDGTPLIDIKPYSPRFDLADSPRGGWTERVSDSEADRRGRKACPRSSL